MKLMLNGTAAVTLQSHKVVPPLPAIESMLTAGTIGLTGSVGALMLHDVFFVLDDYWTLRVCVVAGATLWVSSAALFVHTLDGFLMRRESRQRERDEHAFALQHLSNLIPHANNTTHTPAGLPIEVWRTEGKTQKRITLYEDAQTRRTYDDFIAFTDACIAIYGREGVMLPSSESLGSKIWGSTRRSRIVKALGSYVKIAVSNEGSSLVNLSLGQLKDKLENRELVS